MASLRERGDALVFSDRSREIVSPLLRRSPEQARSWNRVEAMLAVADDVLRDAGLEHLLQAAGTIATAAGFPKATFYTYFENTDVVVECLRQIWVEKRNNS